MKDTDVINLGKKFEGAIKFTSPKKLEGYQLLYTEMGFAKELLTDTLRVPITEDYSEIYTYLGLVEKNKIIPAKEPSDVFVSDNSIGNSKIFLSINNNKIKLGNYEINFVDYIDKGDSYNEGPEENDIGKVGKIIGSKVLYEGNIRSAIQIQIDVGDILNLVIELDNQSEFIKFKVDWVNTYTNHNLQIVFSTPEKIYKTYSEDTNLIIKRNFDPDYNIRKNLPKEKGLEAKNNTAPMQRGVWANGLGIITKGLTQYEILNNNIGICLLRSTDILSNPKNPARTTPAGPPLKLNDLMQLGENIAELYMYIGSERNLQPIIDKIYNYIV